MNKLSLSKIGHPSTDFFWSRRWQWRHGDKRSYLLMSQPTLYMNQRKVDIINSCSIQGHPTRKKKDHNIIFWKDATRIAILPRRW